MAIAGAASSLDCASSTHSADGSTAYAKWSNTKGLSFTIAQRWCIYDEKLGRRIVWQDDGNLVAYSGAHSGGKALWNTHTYGSAARKGSRLEFQTNGNIAILNAAGAWVWATQTNTTASGPFYFSIEPGPNLVDNGAGAVASMHLGSETKSRWYRNIEGPQTNDGSGQPVPVGRLNGWAQTLAEDFNQPAANADFAAKYGDSWCAYGDGTGGIYYDSQIVSAHNGRMDMAVDGNVAAAGAFGPLGQCWASTYGRYSIRFAATGGAGYKLAAMLWPSSDIWGDGEIDYAEGRLDGNIDVFQHGVGCGNACQQNIAVVSTGQSLASTWHTATIEWLPNSYKVYLDDKLILATDKQVPTTPHRNTVQVFKRTATANPGHFYIAWVAAWRPA